MADLNSSLESSRLSGEGTTTITTASTSTAVASSCEVMMWESWSSHPSSSTGDEASTSNVALLPDITTTTPSTSRFHDQPDMLCNMESSFQPLAMHLQNSDDNAGVQSSESEAIAFFGDISKSSTYLSEFSCPLPKSEDYLSQWKTCLWPGPDFREFMKWDASPWPGSTTIQLFHDEDVTTQKRDLLIYGQAHQSSKRLEICSSSCTFSDIHPETNPVLELSSHGNQNPAPTAWVATSTPEVYAEFESRPQKQLLNFVCSSQDPQTSVMVESSPAHAGDLAAAPRKQHRRGGDEPIGMAPKRQRLQEDYGSAESWQNQLCENDLSPGTRRMVNSTVEPVWRSGGLHNTSAASQAMELFAIGPALNTDGKPRARRGSATDPQSVYARHRREKINERLKTLQHLVPNGTKVDIVTMLDEAVHYVQFLQLQLKLLKSDKYWIHATPNLYKGIGLINQPTQVQGQGPEPGVVELLP